MHGFASAAVERPLGGVESARGGRHRFVAPVARARRGRRFRASAGVVVAAVLALAPWAACSAAPPPSPRAAAALAGADRAAVAAARRFLCPHGGTPMRGRCRGSGAVGAGREASVRGWDTGLPAPVRRQSPCPEGTVRTGVLHWDDAVRCLPK